jgi:hypothetical protein
LGLVVLGLLLVAIYGYASGVYYRARVAASAGRESRAVLELVQYQYRVGRELRRPASLGVLYSLDLARVLHVTPDSWDRWFFIGIFVCLIAFIQFSRWGYHRDTMRYYSLLSTQEMSRELESRRQNLIRSLTVCGTASVAGLVFAHSLFVFPPLTSAQQNAYGLAFILFLIGIGNVFDYFQIQRWKQRLSRREHNVSVQKKEA